MDILENSKVKEGIVTDRVSFYELADKIGTEDVVKHTLEALQQLAPFADLILKENVANFIYGLAIKGFLTYIREYEEDHS